VGDSVTAFGDMAAGTLGKVTLQYSSGDRFFRARIADERALAEISARPGGDGNCPAPLHQGRRRRAQTLYNPGCNEEFGPCESKSGRFKKYQSGSVCARHAGTAGPRPTLGRHDFVTCAEAESLSRDPPYFSQDELSLACVESASVVTDGHWGKFSNAGEPVCASMLCNLAELQKRVEQRRANLRRYSEPWGNAANSVETPPNKSAKLWPLADAIGMCAITDEVSSIANTLACSGSSLMAAAQAVSTNATHHPYFVNDWRRWAIRHCRLHGDGMGAHCGRREMPTMNLIDDWLAKMDSRSELSMFYYVIGNGLALEERGVTSGFASLSRAREAAAIGD